MGASPLCGCTGDRTVNSGLHGCQAWAAALQVWLPAAPPLAPACRASLQCQGQSKVLAAATGQPRGHMRRTRPSRSPPACTAARHRVRDGLLSACQRYAASERRQCDPRAAGASPRGRAASCGRATNSGLRERTGAGAIGAPERPAVHAPLAAAAAAAGVVVARLPRIYI